MRLKENMFEINNFIMWCLVSRSPAPTFLKKRVETAWTTKQGRFSLLSRFCHVFVRKACQLLLLHSLAWGGNGVRQLSWDIELCYKWLRWETNYLLCNCKAFHLGNRYLILSFQSWTKCESSNGRAKMVTTMERRETRRTRSRTEMTRTRRMSRWSPQTTTTTTILFLFTSLAVTQAHVALTFPPARWRTFTFFASYFFVGGLHSFSLCIFWDRKYEQVAPLQPHPWFSRIVGQISILGPSHGPTDLFPSGMPTLTSTSSIFCPMPKLGNTSTHFEGFIPNL